MTRVTAHSLIMREAASTGRLKATETKEPAPEAPSKREPATDLRCQFCGEAGFDLVVLKIHYSRGWCDEWNQTPSA